jgi:uncharacterized protein with NRDE domain
MCSVIILRRPEHERWPLLLAANRDELATRPTAPPDRHWVDRPDVVAGLDRQAFGSWLGLNDHGVIAAVLNRFGTLGPEAGKRSRGELVLEALDHADAETAAAALAHLDPSAYRPFNLLVADAADAFWIRHAGDGMVRSIALEPGIAMLSSRELNDPQSPRIRRYLPLFRAAEPPDPDRPDWSSWQLLLAAKASETGDPRDAMCIETDGPYGTVSASLIALPPLVTDPVVWLYADGPPDRADFVAVALREAGA